MCCSNLVCISCCLRVLGNCTQLCIVPASLLAIGSLRYAAILHKAHTHTHPIRQNIFLAPLHRGQTMHSVFRNAHTRYPVLFPLRTAGPLPVARAPGRALQQLPLARRQPLKHRSCERVAVVLITHSNGTSVHRAGAGPLPVTRAPGHAAH